MPEDKPDKPVIPKKPRVRQEDIDKTLQELEELNNKPPKPKEDESGKPPKKPDEVAPQPKPGEEGKPPTPPKKEELTTEEWKKKFIASSQEAIVLHSQNKQVMDAIRAASQMPVPTDDEMKELYSDWEDMSEFEQGSARDREWNKRRFGALEKAGKRFQKLEDWVKKVEAFVGDPETLNKNPQLEGNLEEFKIFASKPGRRGTDWEVLVAAFLHGIEASRPASPSGAMFETGSGGPNEPPKPVSDKLTMEQARELRDTDYRKWLEYVKAGKIDTSEVTG